MYFGKGFRGTKSPRENIVKMHVTVLLLYGQLPHLIPQRLGQTGNKHGVGRTGNRTGRVHPKILPPNHIIAFLPGTVYRAADGALHKGTGGIADISHGWVKLFGDGYSRILRHHQHRFLKVAEPLQFG